MFTPTTEMNMSPTEELRNIDLLLGYFHGRRNHAVGRMVLIELRQSVFERANSRKQSELLDEIETAYDMLTALDKTGDGIGGDIGHGVSAVALAARSALDNALSMVRAMGVK